MAVAGIPRRLLIENRNQLAVMNKHRSAVAEGLAEFSEVSRMCRVSVER
jgi:hypothetical protein